MRLMGIAKQGDRRWLHCSSIAECNNRLNDSVVRVNSYGTIDNGIVMRGPTGWAILA